LFLLLLLSLLLLLLLLLLHVMSVPAPLGGRMPIRTTGLSSHHKTQVFAPRRLEIVSPLRTGLRVVWQPVCL
jgi:hypothetical protein